MFNKFIFSLSKNIKKHVFLSVLFNIFALLLGIAINAVIVFALEQAFNTTLQNIWIIYGAILGVIAFGLRAIFVRQSGRQSYLATGDIKTQIRSELQAKHIRLQKEGQDKLPTAEITQLALEGAEQIEAYTSVFLPQFFYSLTAVFTVFTVISFISLKTALILLLCIPLIPLSVLAVVSFAKKLFTKYWGSYTGMGGDFLDNVQGMAALKIYRADEYMNKKMNKSAEAFRKITMKVLTMQLNSITVMDIIAYGGAAAGIIVALSQMLGGEIGAYQALFVALLSAEFFLPLRALGSAFHIAMNGISGAKKIEEYLKLPEQNVDGVKQVEGKTFEINNVSFGYDKTKLVLDSFNMQIKKGEFVCLVGESGSGKSTAAALLTSALKPNSGAVKADGIDVKDINFYELNKMVKQISFDSRVFMGTVRDNLLMADENARDEYMIDALQKSSLWDFILENGGLDMTIEEGGSNLSGGQRQRLALARIFLSKAKLYIFDEALSGIDADNEKKIIDNIIELAKDSAVLFITHRLECCKSADKIYLIKDGKAELGTHSSFIVDAESHYSKMYKAQRKILDLGGKVVV